MSNEKNTVLQILLDSLNSDSGLKEVPPDYVIHISNSEFSKSAKSLLSTSELNASQQEKLKMILLINKILICIKDDEKDLIEEKLIIFCREFVEQMGLGNQLR